MRNSVIFVVLLFVAHLGFANEPAKLFLSFEQRWAMSYALQSIGLNAEENKKLLSQAIQQMKIFSQAETQVISVSSFDEFLLKWKGEWPSTHSLALDLELLPTMGNWGPRKFQANHPDLQKQIDEYRLEQSKKLLEFLKLQFPETALPANNIKALQLVGSPIEMQRVFEEKFNQIQELSSKMINVDFGSQTPLEKAFGMAVKTFFADYYRNQRLDAKKRMVSALLGEDLNLNEVSRFEIIIQNSGPILQKLLQVMARQADLPAHLKNIFSRLEDAVKPVPWILVKNILTPENSGFKFDTITEKPLGVGSIAQIHAVSIDNVALVARFPKPGIEIEIEQDSKILSEAAAKLDSNSEYLKTGAPKMSSMVNEIRQSVIIELDLNNTIKNQRQAFKVYTADVKIKADGKSLMVQFRVPEVIKPTINTNKPTQVMVQTMAIGKKMEKAVQDSNLKRILIETLARQWVRELLFGSYFYHADLHQGNYFVHLGENINFNLLDYGMAGKLTATQRSYMLLFGIAIKAKKQTLITESLWRVSTINKNLISRKSFEEKSRVFFQENPQAQMLEWISFAVNEGLSLHYDFINMNRGATVLEKTLKEYNSELKISDVIVQESWKRPLQISMLMHGQGNLNWWEILKVGTVEAAKSTAKSCRRFFNQLRAEN